MKSYKILLISTFLLTQANLASCQIVDSLSRATVFQKATALTEKMEYELSLNNNQKEKVLKILTERINLINEKSKSISYINTKTKKQLAAILTQEQLATFENLRMEARRQKLEYLQKNPEFSFSDEDNELEF